MKKSGTTAAVLCSLIIGLAATAEGSGTLASGARTPLTLDDLLADPDLVDAALSPSGRFLAVVLWRKDHDMLVLMDLENKTNEVLTNIPRKVAGATLEVHILSVFWKTEDRILFRTRILPEERARFGRSSEQTVLKLGDRLFAIGRDGGNMRRLLGDNAEGALDGAFNLGRIASMLPHDPDHVLLVTRGFAGPSLFKTNIHTGVGLLMEKPQRRINGWWLDLHGNAVLREEYANGSVRLLRRESDGKWKKILSHRINRLGERPEVTSLAPSAVAGRFFVLARPEGKDRRGVYLYDVAAETFGDVLAEHPQYDLDSATVSRDGKRLLHYCYIAHVRICEFADRKIDAHLRGIRKYFHESANVEVADASEDGSTLLLHVAGPADPPAYYYYRTSQARIEPVGLRHDRFLGKALPTAEVIRWKASDELELSGYLTRPPGAANVDKLPLVVMPHGGPVARDHLDFDVWVQFLAAKGYAVFQPNFRGSDGFGLEFVRRGYREWGGRMQRDITEGVDALIASGAVDPARVCIVGASYGGYAALAGATMTPDKYLCAVSISGISDLSALISWLRMDVSTDSETWRDLLEMFGDPEKDGARLDATSPAKLAAAVKAPILLIHGVEDGVTPISQSERMMKALEKAGRPVEMIRLYQTGHTWWPNKVERKVLESVDAFLTAKLGPGYAGTVNP
jgi:dienelactone hydrolase